MAAQEQIQANRGNAARSTGQLVNRLIGQPVGWGYRPTANLTILKLTDLVSPKG